MSDARISTNNGCSFVDPVKLDWDEAMELCRIGLFTTEISMEIDGEPDPREWLRKYATCHKRDHGAWPIVLG